MSDTTIFGFATSKRFGHFAIALTLALSAALPASTAPASAGLLDMLFGRKPAPPPVFEPITAPPPAGAQRPVATNRKPATAKSKARAGIGKGQAAEKIAKGPARPDVLPGPVGQFLLDPTLRRGDVVVTSEGLKIFNGAGRRQHEEGDFVALSAATQFKAGASPTLAAIDKANIRSAQPLVEDAAEVLPKPEPKVVEKPKPDKRAKRAALGAGTRVQ